MASEPSSVQTFSLNLDSYAANAGRRMEVEELLMGHFPTIDITRRQAGVAAVGAAPLIVPLTTDVPWVAAFAVSGLVALLVALRPLLSVLLHHFHETRQQRNRHTEAMLRENHQHAEVMLMLGKVSEGGELHVDVAEVVEQIRQPATATLLTTDATPADAPAIADVPGTPGSPAPDNAPAVATPS
ncbi:hypothetical protein [Streptomyces sp. NBC_00648]|uniref:hypothetical protein n=1 Tax=Streptomyces sp. NBC_00648 TaxID=2975797 RepID=UPI003244698A